MAKPSVTLRATKGTALTYTELDTNFTNLKDATVTLTAGSGGTAVTSDLNDTITLVAGSNVTLTGNNSAKTITIASSSGASFTLSAGATIGSGTLDSGETLSIIGGVGLSSQADLTNNAITIDLDNTAVTPASYTNASITVDAQGRITAASSNTTVGTVNEGAQYRLTQYSGASLSRTLSESELTYYPSTNELWFGVSGETNRITASVGTSFIITGPTYSSQNATITFNENITLTPGTGKIIISDDVLNVSTSKTPANASATGATGDICWDSDYIYVCTATNTWKRTAIATW